jgi:xylulose-5-phosphate/fructose-6-phosphate phosphoketolase
MSANPVANGGLPSGRPPRLRDYAVDVDNPGTTSGEATACSAASRDVIVHNPQNFRIFA